MSISTRPASPWPARAAYFSAAIFVGASGATNITFGWSKGDSFAGSAVWATVAGAVAIVFAIAWPAMIRSLEARRWSAALMAFAALLLSGAYSVTAALGSAAAGRMNAAATETATISSQARAQVAYDVAKAELAKLAPTRPAGELEALLAGAQRDPRRYGCAAVNGSLAVSCPKLEAELARARQRGKLQAELDKASAALSGPPAKAANSDAKALARYLAAAGVEIGTDRLNDLLVLLAVVMVEAGGGLSLALGMALQNSPRTFVEPRTSGRSCEPNEVAGQPDTPYVPTERSVLQLNVPVVQACSSRTPVVRPFANVNSIAEHAYPSNSGRSAKNAENSKASLAVRSCLGKSPNMLWRIDFLACCRSKGTGMIAEWLRKRGGQARTTIRALANDLERPPSTVHGELRRLALEGHITLKAERRATVLGLS